jgi:hypothetical protein
MVYRTSNGNAASSLPTPTAAADPRIVLKPTYDIGLLKARLYYPHTSASGIKYRRFTLFGYLKIARCLFLAHQGFRVFLTAFNDDFAFQSIETALCVCHAAFDRLRSPCLLEFANSGALTGTQGAESCSHGRRSRRVRGPRGQALFVDATAAQFLKDFGWLAFS